MECTKVCPHEGFKIAESEATTWKKSTGVRIDNRKR